jgi:hypothetical protein
MTEPRPPPTDSDGFSLWKLWKGLPDFIQALTGFVAIIAVGLGGAAVGHGTSSPGPQPTATVTVTSTVRVISTTPAHSSTTTPVTSPSKVMLLQNLTPSGSPPQGVFTGTDQANGNVLDHVVEFSADEGQLSQATYQLDGKYRYRLNAPIAVVESLRASWSCQYSPMRRLSPSR